MDVVHALDASQALKNDLITAATIQSEVTLSGTVSSEASKQLAESIASHVDGVTKVHNNLTVGNPGADAQNHAAGPDAEAQEMPTPTSRRRNGNGGLAAAGSGSGPESDQDQYPPQGQYPAPGALSAAAALSAASSLIRSRVAPIRRRGLRTRIRSIHRQYPPHTAPAPAARLSARQGACNHCPGNAVAVAHQRAGR